MMKALLAAAAIVRSGFDLQLFATTGTTVLANGGAPKRTATREPIQWPIDTTVTPAAGPLSGQAGGIGAGELVYMTSNKKIASLSTPGASNANAANCVGVAVGQYPPLLTDGVYAPEPSSSPQGATPYLDVYESGDFLFKTTAADTYSPLDTVYLGADGQTIQKTATGTAVGYVSPDQRPIGGVGLGGFSVAPPSFPITGGAGVMLYIRIKPALTGAN